MRLWRVGYKVNSRVREFARSNLIQNLPVGVCNCQIVWKSENYNGLIGGPHSMESQDMKGSVISFFAKSESNYQQL